MERVQTLKQMTHRNPPSPGEVEFLKIIESPEAAATLRQVLREITTGPAFKGSQRSGQFLEFVVEQSIAGNFDLLKERLIGIELFKREPSYDTGEDAIVRVTASDVRKRLLQHYGWFGSVSEFRIDLPLGSYIPRVRRTSATPEDSPALIEPIQTLNPQSAPSTSSSERNTAVLAGTGQSHVSPHVSSDPVTAQHRGAPMWQLVSVVAALLMAGTAGWYLGAKNHPAPQSPPKVLPWSALFGSQGSAHLITSDANINTVEGITRTNLSLSDYANHKYIPDANTLTPEQLRFCKILLSADAAAATPDLPITARVAQIAQTFSKKLIVQTSRGFQLSFLNNSDNFIFLGSPRSNPWFSAFSSALSFQFVFQPAVGSEFIHNLHPQKSEQADYIPSANGGGTGYSFAIIAFVPNPDQNGEILLLSGADGEATAAAGDFVTDLPRMAHALQKCGLGASGTTGRHFEMLLQTDTMAGVSRRTDVIACHALATSAAASASNS